MYKCELSICGIGLVLLMVLGACAAPASPASDAAPAAEAPAASSQDEALPSCPDELPEPELCRADMATSELTPLDFSLPQAEDGYWFARAAYENRNGEAFAIEVIGASEQGTMEYVGYLPLLVIGDSDRFLPDLDQGVLSQDFQIKWNESAPAEYQLSDVASVSVISLSTRWQIGDQDKVYVASVSAGMLSIYVYDSPILACFDLVVNTGCTISDEPQAEFTIESLTDNDVAVWISPQDANGDIGALVFDYVIDPRISQNTTHYYPKKTGTQSYVYISVQDGAGSVKAGLCRNTSVPLPDKIVIVDKNGSTSNTIAYPTGSSAAFTSGVKGVGVLNRYRISNRAGWVGWFADYYSTSGWGTTPTCKP